MASNIVEITTTNKYILRNESIIFKFGIAFYEY